MPLIAQQDPRFSLTLRLVHAAELNDLDAVRTLLDAGAPAGGVVYERFTALAYAIEHGNRAMAQALFDAGATSLDPDQRFAEPAFHRAVLFGHYEDALWLLDRADPQFSPDLRNADGYTGLQLLAMTPRDDLEGPQARPLVRLVERLLEMGADPQAPLPPDPEDEGSLEQRPQDAVGIARSLDRLDVLSVLERALLRHPPSLPDDGAVAPHAPPLKDRPARPRL